MAGDDFQVVADENGVGEAEALDTVGDLANLLLRVGSDVKSNI